MTPYADEIIKLSKEKPNLLHEAGVGAAQTLGMGSALYLMYRLLARRPPKGGNLTRLNPKKPILPRTPKPLSPLNRKIKDLKSKEIFETRLHKVRPNKNPDFSKRWAEFEEMSKRGPKLAAANKREWLKVEDYRSRKGRGELVLKARGKRLWFPMDPGSYKEFKTKLRGSQAEALAFAKQHVRSDKTEEPYQGTWSGAGSRYYRKNKLPMLGFKKKWDVSGARREFPQETEKVAISLPVFGGMAVAGMGSYAAYKLLRKAQKSRRLYERPITYGDY